VEEGQKQVLGTMASILVLRHLKTIEDLHDSRGRVRPQKRSWVPRFSRFAVTCVEGRGFECL
jgi:hypothetical protein